MGNFWPSTAEGPPVVEIHVSGECARCWSKEGAEALRGLRVLGAGTRSSKNDEPGGAPSVVPTLPSRRIRLQTELPVALPMDVVSGLALAGKVRMISDDAEDHHTPKPSNEAIAALFFLSQGYWVLNGIKYGATFAIYPKDPGLCHSSHLVRVVDR
eukprot:gene13114-20244_t